MRSFTNLVADFVTLSKDASGTTLGEVLINQFIKKVLIARDWTFNRSSYEDASVVEQQAYPLPYNCWRIRSIKVTVDEVNYFPKEVISREMWDRLNRVSVYSDGAKKFFVEPDEVALYPIQATSDNVIKIYFQKLIRDLSSDNDYVADTVTVTARSKAVVGNGTTFLASMVGMFLTFDADANYYEIASFTDTTHITLKRETKVAVNAGNADIVDVIPFPSGFESIPLWWALDVYFKSNEQPAIARGWEKMWKESLAEMIRRDAKSTGNVLTKDEIDSEIANINDYPEITAP